MPCAAPRSRSRRSWRPPCRNARHLAVRRQGRPADVGSSDPRPAYSERVPEFDYSRLRRFPDVEAPNLQAWDATDELLVRHALASGAAGDEIAVIGDEYGAITLALVDAGLRGVRVHQDLVTGRRALANNAATLGMDGFASHELDVDLLDGARLVLLQLPKALAELEEIADAVARWAAPDAVLVAGGRVKHMTLAQNEVLAKSFSTVQAQRAERKSRLVIASDPLLVPAEPPFPVRQQHDGLVLCAFGGAFAGARIDIGTRVLLGELDGLAARFRSQLRRSGAVNEGGALRRAQGPSADEGAEVRVVDLGCGTGALAAAFALRHPDAVVVAT